MKITKAQLKKLIREELEALDERSPVETVGSSGMVPSEFSPEELSSVTSPADEAVQAVLSAVKSGALSVGDLLDRILPELGKGPAGGSFVAKSEE